MPRSPHYPRKHSFRMTPCPLYLLVLACISSQRSRASLPLLFFSLSPSTYMHYELPTSYLPRPLQAFPFFPGCPASFGPPKKKNGSRNSPLAFALSNSTSPLPSWLFLPLDSRLLHNLTHSRLQLLPLSHLFDNSSKHKIEVLVILLWLRNHVSTNSGSHSPNFRRIEVEYCRRSTKD